MNTIQLDNDIKVMYINATSFPGGVMEAHEKLHALVPFSTERKYFGLSRPENGDAIIYKAAAEEIKEGEAKELNLETIILKKGNYFSIPVNDYMENIPAIGNAFQTLIAQPGIGDEGYCVEWYINGGKDILCIVRAEQ